MYPPILQLIESTRQEFREGVWYWTHSHYQCHVHGCIERAIVFDKDMRFCCQIDCTRRTQCYVSFAYEYDGTPVLSHGVFNKDTFNEALEFAYGNVMRKVVDKDIQIESW